MKKNKMLIGFGISSPEDVKNLTAYCEGVIVGSAVIKSLMHQNKVSALSLIKNLKASLKMSE